MVLLLVFLLPLRQMRVQVRQPRPLFRFLFCKRSEELFFQLKLTVSELNRSAPD